MSLRTPSSVEFLSGLLSEANLNFLIGAGASSPAIPLLGELERLSAHPAMKEAEEGRRRVVQAALDGEYLDEVLAPNLALKKDDARGAVSGYAKLVDGISRILLARRNHLLPKRANLFTSNQDVFIEAAFERRGIEVRDGFRGRGESTLRIDDLNTRTFRVNRQFELTAEVPTFTLQKMHGSVNWKHGAGDAIALDQDLDTLKSAVAVRELLGRKLPSAPTSEDIEESVSRSDPSILTELQPFIDAYAALAVINPTKEKFAKVVLQQQYYEQLRALSNELERENSVLFVIGFSFADEHIRRLVVRALNGNPTLIVYVFCFDDQASRDITDQFSGEELLFDNLKLLAPSEWHSEIKHFDLQTVVEQMTNAVALPAG